MGSLKEKILCFVPPTITGKEKVTLKWSKKEHDWIITYPEWENRNPRILWINFLSMMREYAEWKWQSIEETIEQIGFDPKTFTMSVKIKYPSPNPNI